MRIIAGKFGGRRLLSPKNNATRPTTDRVRESLFSILQNSYPDHLNGSNILDLFAGTGALGFEAISRGAKLCTFVDSSAKACALIKDNIAGLALLDRCNVKRMNIINGLANLTSHATTRKFQLIFLDPPYGHGLSNLALEIIAGSELLDIDALLIVEEALSSEIIIPDRLKLVDQRRYGGTKLLFLVNLK